MTALLTTSGTVGAHAAVVHPLRGRWRIRRAPRHHRISSKRRVALPFLSRGHRPKLIPVRDTTRSRHFVTRALWYDRGPSAPLTAIIRLGAKFMIANRLLDHARHLIGASNFA